MEKWLSRSRGSKRGESEIEKGEVEDILTMRKISPSHRVENVATKHIPHSRVTTLEFRISLNVLSGLRTMIMQCYIPYWYVCLSFLFLFPYFRGSRSSTRGSLPPYTVTRSYHSILPRFVQVLFQKNQCNLVI